MSAPSAGPRTPADDGWAILAQPPGERDLVRDEYWHRSGERSRRRREAPRRSALVRRGGGRASIALAAVVLGGPIVSDGGAVAQATTASSGPGLSRGASGSEVRALQRALGITADGAFGPATERAVRSFQRAHGIPVTGTVGPRTRKALQLTGATSRSAPAQDATGGGMGATTDAPAASGGDVQAAVSAAMRKVGAPYSAGATGPDAFDCSGLVTWAMKQAGISVPRTSYAQFGLGTRVAKDSIQAGDLVFFNTAGPGASDVGIATSPTTAVSATTHGVMTHAIATGYWGSHFVGARRVS